MSQDADFSLGQRDQDFCNIETIFSSIGRYPGFIQDLGATCPRCWWSWVGKKIAINFNSRMPCICLHHGLRMAKTWTRLPWIVSVSRRAPPSLPFCTPFFPSVFICVHLPLQQQVHMNKWKKERGGRGGRGRRRKRKKKQIFRSRADNRSSACERWFSLITVIGQTYPFGIQRKKSLVILLLKVIFRWKIYTC